MAKILPLRRRETFDLSRVSRAQADADLALLMAERLAARGDIGSAARLVDQARVSVAEHLTPVAPRRRRATIVASFSAVLALTAGSAAAFFGVNDRPADVAPILGPATTVDNPAQSTGTASEPIAGITESQTSADTRDTGVAPAPAATTDRGKPADPERPDALDRLLDSLEPFEFDSESRGDWSGFESR